MRTDMRGAMRGVVRAALLFVALASSAQAHQASESDSPPATPPAEASGALTGHAWEFGGVPALNYDADNGLGYGAVVSAFAMEQGFSPYRFAVTVQVFLTSRWIQDHQLRIDALDVLDLPLRVSFRGGYFQSLTQPFCGYGNAVTCDPAVAEAKASSLGLKGEEQTQFERRYYLTRFIQPNANLLLRWRLNDLPHRFEWMAGWRMHGYLPGSWSDDDGDGAPDLSPYPGSHYARFHPEGEPGVASVLQAGMMIDNRDNEPAPTRGYWAESSLRAASPLWGSTWSYIGANATVRGYVPLTADRSVVLAKRMVVDCTWGDLPLQELIRVGGSLDYTAFGGNPMGRGIRVQRYVGRMKVLDQTEVRYQFADTTWAGQRFRWSTGAFLDAGWIGLAADDIGGEPLGLRMGYGATLRVRWNENFIIRVDLAQSPHEPGLLAPYIDIGQPF